MDFLLMLAEGEALGWGAGMAAVGFTEHPNSECGCMAGECYQACAAEHGEQAPTKPRIPRA